MNQLIHNLHFLKSGFFCLLFLAYAYTSYAQIDVDVDEEIEKYYEEEVVKNTDTSYIDYQVDAWSLRAYSIFKNHSFHLRSSETTLNYIPNNRFGIGFGVAYYPFLLDIGFNIKPKQKDPTNRFDLQGNLIFREHYIGLVIQDYKGFNINSPDIENEVFREDIRSSTLYLTYGYIFNSKRVSIGSILSGFHQQKKSVGSFILGGFLNYYKLQADSSIVPNEQPPLMADLQGTNGYKNIGGGILGGYGYVLVFPHNFYSFFSLLPGLGLIYKTVYTETDSYHPSMPLLYRLNLNISFGYNSSKYYFILTFNTDISATSLDSGNWGALNIGKAKLIFGYKFSKKGKRKK
jgi:hypothetical protein